jgi:hypothetical protein
LTRQFHALGFGNTAKCLHIWERGQPDVQPLAQLHQGFRLKGAEEISLAQRLQHKPSCVSSNGSEVASPRASKHNYVHHNFRLAQSGKLFQRVVTTEARA